MAERDNGGAAFPYWQEYNGDVESSSGMSLRDYFAAKAMAALIISDKDDLMPHAKIAKAAYLASDAMLAERSK